MANAIRLDAKNVGKVMSKEQFAGLAKTGEVLGCELMDLLADYGCSMEGLVLETYAMAKAWGTLKVIAASKGYDPTNLFNFLLPAFIEDAEHCKEELEREGR